MSRGTPPFHAPLKAAVRAFAATIQTGSPLVADMSGLLAVTPTLPLTQVSHWERQMRGEFFAAMREWDDVPSPMPTTSWRRLFRPAGWQKATTATRPLTWLDLSSGDGRTRERTLRTLIGPVPGSFFFALALLRLNDWVPQVRAAARETVPALARASDAEVVAEVLCAVLPAWTQWGRLGEDERGVVSELMAIEAVSEGLRRRVMRSAAGPMSAVLSQMLRTPRFDADLAAIAVGAIQPWVRARAYRMLLLGQAVWADGWEWKGGDRHYGARWRVPMLRKRPLEVERQLLAHLMAAASDHSPIVRRVAAEALIREMGELGDVVPALARRLSEDADPPVAERGVFALKRLEAAAQG